MDWDVSYQVSRSLTLEIGRSGRLVGTSSISRPPQELQLDSLPVLMEFGSPSTPTAVFARLQEEWELEREGFAEVVDVLLEQAFLVPAATSDGPVKVASLATRGFASLLSHQRMLVDTVRVQSYRTAIFRHAAGKSVVEVGCGSGILSIFAAQAGARSVVAIEESEIASLAEEMFAANRCNDVIDLRRANSRDVELDEPADLVIHEILGTDPFAESILPAILDARRRFLKPGGRLLPYRIEVCCLGLEYEERPYRDKARAMAETREVAGLYGVDFQPIFDRLAAMRPQNFPPPIDARGVEIFKPKILSEELRLMDLDLRIDLPDFKELLKTTSRLQIANAGRLGAVITYFRAHLDETLFLSTSPHAPFTSWGYDIRPLSRQVQVSPGDEISLELEVESFLGRQRVTVDLA